MKALIVIVLVMGLYMLGKSVFRYAKVKQAQEEAAARGDPAKPADGLDGLPPQFESSLQTAVAQGAPALKAWIDRYRFYVKDPKLAAIELDYVVLVSRSNPAEAKRAFQSVKARIRPGSPVYERVKRLNATYGQ